MNRFPKPSSFLIRSTFSMAQSKRKNVGKEAANQLTACQCHAWEMLQGDSNMFLTGAAGTGKSFLVRQFLREAGTFGFPVVASTGAAAILVGGCTFHSFFGLGIMEGGVQGTIQRAIRNGAVTSRLQRIRGVIIDEVSMLPGATLHAAETIARIARHRSEPWGGLRIIAVGDFAQLPPVNSNGEAKDWAFLHEVWERSEFATAMLQTVVRTTEPEFLQVLNLIRQGFVTEEVIRFLDSKVTEPDLHFEGTRLFPHRAKAESHNLERLAELPSPLHSFPTHYTGIEPYILQLKKNAPIPEVLLLKEGALVMLRKNDQWLRWVNGSLGYLTKICSGSLEIALLDGQQIEIGHEDFTLLDGNGRELATALNYPVNLAWATTIHKAQGVSLDRLMVDLSKLWEPGQAYVALSRVRSSDGLYIERWAPGSIIVEPLVTQFYVNIDHSS